MKEEKRGPESAAVDYRSFQHSAVLLGISAVLVCAAFVPELWGVAVFVALVPALVAARRAPLWRLFWLSWAAGWASCLFLYYWVMINSGLGWVFLSAYVATYLAVFLWGVEFLARRFGAGRVVVSICLWGLLEFVRGVLFTGLPWFYLGHALYRWPRLIQTADLGGVIFLGVILVAINALLAECLAGRRRRRKVLAGVLACVICGANLAYGVWRIASVTQVDGPVVGLVQPNVPQSLKILQTPEDSAEIFKYLRSATLSEKMLKADVIIWPETIMPGLSDVGDYTVAFGMKRDALLGELAAQRLLDEPRRRELAKALDANAGVEEVIEAAGDLSLAEALGTDGLLGATARLAGKPLVAGAISAEVDVVGRVVKTYNRAYHYDADGRVVKHYDKVHLVPFGEFVPFRESWPAASRLLASIMPIEPRVYPGGAFMTFEIGGYRYAPAICFEDTFSYVGRECRKLGADVLLNVTNDGWFEDTFELEAHLANSAFRAVETRMAVVRAANTGVSAVISPRGEIVARLRDAGGADRQVSGTLVSRVPVSGDRTVYLIVGHWWLLAALAVLWAVVWRGRGRGI